jgi:ribose transport system ATP-binding protein
VSVDGAIPVLEFRHLSKTFGATKALDDASLQVAAGEIHGLLGENGSGKSTLIKVLAGFHDPDPGAELRIRGAEVELPLPPGGFRALGLSFVHQDLGLVPSLTVMENLLVGELAASRRQPWISWRRNRLRTRETFARYGLSLDPDAVVARLTPMDRALLAIVRGIEEIAGEDGGRLLILDEPTVFLPKTGTDQLFGLLRRIVASGPSVLIVSHNLEEVRAITDRVTVLRDGRTQRTVRTAETSDEELVELIVGRRFAAVEASAPSPALPPQAEERVRVAGVSGEVIDDVSFAVRRGEILGVTGLAGSGTEELPYLLFGGGGARAGTLTLDGRAFELRSFTPHDAIDAGIGLVPANRREHGSYATLPIVDNMLALELGDYFDRLLMRRGRMVAEAAERAERFDVRPRDPRLLYGSLSGGNQQKALLAKWISVDPTLLVLHEPTQGVDIGAREQIFNIVRAVAAMGTSVVCASNDYEQLASLCERVIVLADGRVIDVLEGGDVNKHEITERALYSLDSLNRTVPR